MTTRRTNLISLFAALLLGALWTLPFAPDHALGWDEAMHVALPASRFALQLEVFSPRAALQVLVDDCQNYPFSVPVALGLLRLLADALLLDFEFAARLAIRLLWVATAWGAWQLAADVVRRSPRPDGAASSEAATRGRRATIAGALAFVFVALSPAGLAFSGTLFLEVPCAFLAVFALRAWLRRDPLEAVASRAARRDLVFGCWLAALVFAKWNYGLLFLAAFLLDAFVRSLVGPRATGARGALVGLSRALMPLAVTAAWWFLWPWPGGWEHAASHRASFAAYLGSNLEHGRTAPAMKLLLLCVSFAPSARLLTLVAAGAALAASEVRASAAVRTLFVATLAVGGPVLVHDFFLDRFLLPPGVVLWVLAAVGLSRLAAGGRGVLRPVILALVVAACLPFAARDARFVAKRVGLWKPERADYQTWYLTQLGDLSVDRTLPTGGLRRETCVAALDRIASELRAGERFGFVGVSSELSPGTVWLGLLARGAPRADFLRDAHRPSFMHFGGADPGWSDERLAEFASGFDVLLATEPPDWKDRSVRAFAREYRRRIGDGLGWGQRALGTFAVDRPFEEPLQVTLLALRPPAPEADEQ